MVIQEDKEVQFNNFKNFPGTRYMGSKNKIIGEIWEVLKDYQFDSFFDAFSGSNVVSYFMKCMGKQVYTNDFMGISYITSKAIIENNSVTVSESDIELLLNKVKHNGFIYTTFKDLYFTDEENQLLDTIRTNIDKLDHHYKKDIAISALVRACMKKRPRGIFTFVGHRYDDGRADIKKTLLNHFIENIEIFNNAVFDNCKICKAYNLQTEEIKLPTDLVYFDPPYCTPNSDNDYVRRYHFVEGLTKNWEGLEIQAHTKTKKFKSYESPFSNKKTSYQAFDALFNNFKDSKIAVSYSSNSLPNKEEMIDILKKYKSTVEVHEIDHLYSLGNQNHRIGNNANKVKEYLFIGF